MAGSTDMRLSVTEVDPRLLEDQRWRRGAVSKIAPLRIAVHDTNSSPLVALSGVLEE